MLDLRRLTADETLDTIDRFDHAVDRLAFLGLTDAGAPLGSIAGNP